MKMLTKDEFDDGHFFRRSDIHSGIIKIILILQQLVMEN